MPPPHLRKSPPRKWSAQLFGTPLQEGPGTFSAGRPQRAENFLGMGGGGASSGYQVASPGTCHEYLVRSSYDDHPEATPKYVGSSGIADSNVSIHPAENSSPASALQSVR